MADVVLWKNLPNSSIVLNSKKVVVERFVAGESKMELAAAFGMSSEGILWTASCPRLTKIIDWYNTQRVQTNPRQGFAGRSWSVVPHVKLSANAEWCLIDRERQYSGEHGVVPHQV